MRARKELVNLLVEHKEATSSVLEELLTYKWDWDGEPLAIIKTDHILQVLSLFNEGKINAQEVKEWAEAVEVRDDIERDKEFDEIIRTTLFELSTPEITNPIKREYIIDKIASLTLNKRK